MTNPAMSASASTRDRIMLAAAELFSTQNFHGTSTRDIAKQAGITQSALYRHFTSKTDIIQALADDYIDHLTALATQIAQLPASPATRLFVHLLATGNDLIKTQYSPLNILSEPILREPEFKPLWERYGKALRIVQGQVEEAIACQQFCDIQVEAYSYFVTTSLDHLRWLDKHQEAALLEFIKYSLRSALPSASHLKQVVQELLTLETELIPEIYKEKLAEG